MRSPRPTTGACRWSRCPAARGGGGRPGARWLRQLSFGARRASPETRTSGSSPVASRTGGLGRAGSVHPGASRFRGDRHACQHGVVAPVGTPRFWKAVNRLTRPLAGFAPWWVLVETTGRRTGTRRLTPLANAPFDGSTMSVLASYGDASAFVKNIRADSAVRFRRRGRWFSGTAEILDPTSDAVGRLGLWAKWFLFRVSSDPKIVKVTVA